MQIFVLDVLILMELILVIGARPAHLPVKHVPLRHPVSPASAPTTTSPRPTVLSAQIHVPLACQTSTA